MFLEEMSSQYWRNWIVSTCFKLVKAWENTELRAQNPFTSNGSLRGCCSGRVDGHLYQFTVEVEVLYYKDRLLVEEKPQQEPCLVVEQQRIL